MTVFMISSELLILLQPILVWWYIIISQSVSWKCWIIIFYIKITARVQNVNECLSTGYLNHQTFCFKTWYCDASSWVRVSCKKIGLLFSRSRSQHGLIWSDCGNFYCIFWTADPFATKLDLMAHHHKLDFLVKRFDYSAVVKVRVTEKVQNCSECFIIIIIIKLLMARVIGAPQMILQPVFSIFPCSPLPSGTCRTPVLSIPWCCLLTSSSVRGHAGAGEISHIECIGWRSAL